MIVKELRLPDTKFSKIMHATPQTKLRGGGFDISPLVRIAKPNDSLGAAESRIDSFFKSEGIKSVMVQSYLKQLASYTEVNRYSKKQASRSESPSYSALLR